MRIVVISATESEGGAARAARRLHRALLAAGAESSLLVGRKSSADNGVIEVPASEIPDAGRWSLLQQELIDNNRAGQWNTYFSVTLPGTDLACHPAVLEADVIHLHWISGFLSAADIARLLALGKPVVWTMHDERAFTGGCHYTFGCREFASKCEACPQLRDDPQHFPAAILADACLLWSPHALTIVTPSRWMASQARQSTLFGAHRIETIAYALETDLFRPSPKSEARAALGLAPDTLVLLFGADFGVERRKGFHELITALKLCLCDNAFHRRCQERRVTLLCFGHPADELKSLPIPLESLGYMHDDEKLAMVYSASDLFLLPSLADNLPCTMMEAMSCGTPVVAFATGGIPECVEDGVTGRLVPTGDTAQLAQAILDLAKDEPMRTRMGQAARVVVESRYSLKSIGTQHLRLFEELRAHHRKPAPSPGGAVCSAPFADKLPAFFREAIFRKNERDSLSMPQNWLQSSVEKLTEECENITARLGEFTESKEVSRRSKECRTLPIGVLMPTRDAMRYLPNHVQSVAAWLDVVEEVVVVDSHSKDGTVEFLKRNLRHPNLRILTHPPGLYQSWNHGIAQLRSKYTYVSTIGDSITREGLEHLVEAAERTQCDVLVSPPVFTGDYQHDLSEVRWPVHKIIERLSITQPELLDPAGAFSAAVFYAVSCGLQGILGSSASNLYRTPVLQEFPFPTDVGSTGDVLWGVMNALKAKIAVTPFAFSTFLFHPASYDPNTAEFNRKLASQINVKAVEILDRELASPNGSNHENLRILRQLLEYTKSYRSHKLGLEAMRRSWFPWYLRPRAWRERAGRDHLRQRISCTLEHLPKKSLIALWRDMP